MRARLAARSGQRSGDFWVFGVRVFRVGFRELPGGASNVLRVFPPRAGLHEQAGLAQGGEGKKEANQDKEACVGG